MRKALSEGGYAPVRSAFLVWEEAANALPLPSGRRSYLRWMKLLMPEAATVRVL